MFSNCFLSLFLLYTRLRFCSTLNTSCERLQTFFLLQYPVGIYTSCILKNKAYNLVHILELGWFSFRWTDCAFPVCSHSVKFKCICPWCGAIKATFTLIQIGNSLHILKIFVCGDLKTNVAARKISSEMIFVYFLKHQKK